MLTGVGSCRQLLRDSSWITESWIADAPVRHDVGYNGQYSLQTIPASSDNLSHVMGVFSSKTDLMPVILTAPKTQSRRKIQMIQDNSMYNEAVKLNIVKPAT